MTSAPTGDSTDRPVAGDKPRLLFVVTEDWYFLSHRLPMARAAREAGFEVHLATNVTNGASAITREQVVVHPLPLARGRLSPRAMLATAMALRRIHRTVKPTITHHIALQPIVLGLIAVLGIRTACVNSFTGLGFAFTSHSPKAKVIKGAIGALLRLLLDRETMVNVVQNPDDRAALVSLGLPEVDIVLIRGSGVDTERLQPLPEPDGPPTVGFLGRLLADKGIGTLMAAHRLLRAQGADVRLQIAGMPDPANPASVTEQEASSWRNEPGVTWLGHINDISGFWARTHVAVLPSRREGIPLSLLEAAACARPMIATDVPGCREIVVRDETGILVPVDDPPALAAAIKRLADDPQLRARYGAAARRLVLEQFAANVIGCQTVQLYRHLLDRCRPTSTG
jgi:glycosyltransferase involved in cell wall biosynthesis